ncbi:helix-turn-helix transcriptional regulator [Romeria aff. gracilis LEGE 07310]|uniref:Helix-turn-helix transcriptional regulator n=1 Tax=Vasconcelosia minhoensis LEGE 07310 TaxID=915328 RepID=A0A8J7AKN3_9CYAN|nr:AraC family transcriptional regulator [Romeria gracilis]MBE9075841.1 helix-turn-helix transcriptional regulator [Romeria aff. gracilis LEGE 07310]
MAITFSQEDYLEIIERSYEASVTSVPNSQQPLDLTWAYPQELGSGYLRTVRIREGIVLDIADYRPHEDLVVASEDREHPLELCFVLTGVAASELTSIRAGQHGFCGSGMAPGEVYQKTAHRREFEVSIHIDPTLLGQWITGYSGELPNSLSHLIKPSDCTYYSQVCTTHSAMQQVIQQILQCPFQGFTQRMYLESKIWELMTLQLAQLPDTDEPHQTAKPLKPDDVERIHYAKEILVSRLNDPPTLIELARLAGINDCKLKAGFRQVFGTTVFGYLHDCRMEKSRQLLEAGEMSVSNAAQAVGYANRSHFAIAFRKKFGINPSAYRKRQPHFWQTS